MQPSGGGGSPLLHTGNRTGELPPPGSDGTAGPSPSEPLRVPDRVIGHGPAPRLAIYVYELPPSVALRYEVDTEPGFRGHDPIYTAYQHFLARLLADWAVRTEDPGEATLFYVPALGYARHGNVGDPHDALAAARAYVQATWPAYWDRRGGRDHVFWAGANDQGVCWGGDAVRDAIRIVHYGRRDVFPDHSGWLSPCSVEGRDVVAAPYNPKLAGAAAEAYRLPFAERPPRPRGLFFKGSMAGGRGVEYGQGLREEVVAALAGAPGVAIPEGPLTPGEYAEHMLTSRFCLAVTGHGWGMRVSEAVAHGCVPVALEENVALPYEDLLPYEEFSLRVRRADLAGLPALLEAVRPEQLAALQRGVERHHRAFLWGAPGEGGRAYEYTIGSLELRLAQRELGRGAGAGRRADSESDGSGGGVSSAWGRRRRRRRRGSA